MMPSERLIYLNKTNRIKNLSLSGGSEDRPSNSAKVDTNVVEYSKYPHKTLETS